MEVNWQSATNNCQEMQIQNRVCRRFGEFKILSLLVNKEIMEDQETEEHFQSTNRIFSCGIQAIVKR